MGKGQFNGGNIEMPKIAAEHFSVMQVIGG
jgi:hypothetical protein